MAALFGGEGLWAASSSLFFSETEVDRLLNAGEPELSIEALLSADTIVQDTQAHSPRLISYLSTPKAVNRLLYYLTVPQDTSQQDAAYRFPYMACEIISCAVRPILDAIVARTGEHEHMRVLFAFIAPHVLAGSADMWPVHLADDHLAALRRRVEVAGLPTDDTALARWQQECEGATSGTGLLLRPYLAGYWCKVVSMLCRRRPADVCRFLTRVPHVLPALAQQLPNGNFAGLLTSLLDLPLRPARLPAFRLTAAAAASEFRLCSGDSSSVGETLLAVLERALGVARQFTAAAPADAALARECTSAAASACGGVVEVVTACLLKARSSSPHIKFAAEDYNASRLRGSGGSSGGAGDTGGASASMPSGSASTTGIGAGTGTGGASSEGARGEEAAAAAALAAIVAAAVAGTDDDDTRFAAAACRTNTQVDSSFHESSPRPDDSCNTLMLRWLRDGSGAAKLVGIVSSAVAAAMEQWRETGPPPSAALLQSVAAASLDVLTAGLEAIAFGWRQQAVAGFGISSAWPPVSPVSVGPCPSLLRQLLHELPMLCAAAATISQSGLRATTAAASASGSGEAPYPSSPTSPKLGALGLSLCRCLAALLRCGWPDVASAISKSGVIVRLLDCMSAFAWHSVLHRSIADALLACVHEGAAAAASTGASDVAAGAGLASHPAHSSHSFVAVGSVWGLGRALLHDAALLSRIVSACKLAGMAPAIPHAALPSDEARQKERGAAGGSGAGAGAGAGSAVVTSPAAGAPSRSPAGPRVGYGGHMASLANCVLSSYARGKLGAVPTTSPALTPGQQASGADSNAPLVSLVQSHGDWWRFVDRELAVHNVMRGVLIGGLAPDSSKSGQVGANADATGGRQAAVDEVAALDQKKEGEGSDSGSDGSNSDSGSDSGNDDGPDGPDGSDGPVSSTGGGASGYGIGPGSQASSAPRKASGDWGALSGTASASAPHEPSDDWGALSGTASASAPHEPSDDWGALSGSATSAGTPLESSDEWASLPASAPTATAAAADFETGW